MFRNIVTILTDSVPQTVFSKPYHIPCQKHVPKKISVHQKSLWNNKNPFGNPKRTEPTGNRKSLPAPPGSGLRPAGRQNKQDGIKKGGSRGLTPDGNPQGKYEKRTFRESRKGLDQKIQRKNAAARYSPTPSRVQYHRRSQALASGFGKGPGVSPGP